MSLFKKIKRFWIRKVLRRIYDPDEIFKISINHMNLAEVKLFTKNLYTIITEMQEDLEILTNYVSEVPTPCDKCSNLEFHEPYCFKCEGAGVIKNKHLCNWPWED